MSQGVSDCIPGQVPGPGVVDQHKTNSVDSCGFFFVSFFFVLLVFIVYVCGYFVRVFLRGEEEEEQT